jgi:hypothetical protein
MESIVALGLWVFVKCRKPNLCTLKGEASPGETEDWKVRARPGEDAAADRQTEPTWSWARGDSSSSSSVINIVNNTQVVGDPMFNHRVDASCRAATQHAAPWHYHLRYVCCCIWPGDTLFGGDATRMPVLGFTMGIALCDRTGVGCWILWVAG